MHLIAQLQREDKLVGECSKNMMYQHGILVWRRRRISLPLALLVSNHPFHSLATNVMLNGPHRRKTAPMARFYDANNRRRHVGVSKADLIFFARFTSRAWRHAKEVKTACNRISNTDQYCWSCCSSSSCNKFNSITFTVHSTQPVTYTQPR